LISSNEAVEGFSFPVHLGFGSGGLFEKLRRTIEKHSNPMVDTSNKANGIFWCD